MSYRLDDLAGDLAAAGHRRPRVAAVEAWLRGYAHDQGLLSTDELWPRPRRDGTVPDPASMKVVRDRLRRRRR